MGEQAIIQARWNKMFFFKQGMWEMEQEGIKWEMKTNVRRQN